LEKESDKEEKPVQLNALTGAFRRQQALCKKTRRKKGTPKQPWEKDQTS